MKRITRACLALTIATLTACSAAGGSRGAVVPEAAPYAASQTKTSGFTLTGLYPIPAFGYADVAGITVGPDRRLWFSMFGLNAIGAITTAGVLSSWPTPANAQPNGIAVGRSPKHIWSGGYGGTMISSTIGGAQTDYPITGAHIGGLILGPDKNVWFADYGNHEIGRITATGAVTEFPLPAGTIPSGIAVGSDGNFWITDGGNNDIIKVAPTGAVLHRYAKGFSSGESPNGIVAAPDGNLYVSEDAANLSIADKIARVTTRGKITEIGTLPPDAYPNLLTVGKDKNVYFSLVDLQAVGSIVLSTGKVSYHFLPLVGVTGTSAIVSGPDGRLWLGGTDAIYAVSY
jgi:streptogramin lyase